MAASTRSASTRRTAAQRRAARQAEEAAKVLHSFAATLNALDMAAAPAPAPTPRNWWRLQAGRFKDDPSFPDFIARVQASRRRED